MQNKKVEYFEEAHTMQMHKNVAVPHVSILALVEKIIL